MNIEKNKDYNSLAEKHLPSSPVLKNAFLAFFTGGFLCFSGQWLAFLWLLSVSSLPPY